MLVCFILLGLIFSLTFLFAFQGETSYIRVYPERSTSYGYSRSRSGSRGRDSPYQSRGSPHYFSPFRPYWDRWWEFCLYFLGELSCFVLRIYIPDWWFSVLGDFFNFLFFFKEIKLHNFYQGHISSETFLTAEIVVLVQKRVVYFSPRWWEKNQCCILVGCSSMEISSYCDWVGPFCLEIYFKRLITDRCSCLWLCS